MPQSRLIQIQDLPNSLWLQDEHVLCLPPALTTTWTALLDEHSLRSRAEQRRPETGPTGGADQDKTDNHLAWSFAGSAARVQLAMLDPHSHLPDVADAFARIFAGGRVAMADLPCGAGAATLAILTTLAELRSQALIPREPLEIVLIGGDFSTRARDHAVNAFARVKPALERQAIFVEESFHPWNVLEPLSNTDLIQELTTRSQTCGARMLVLANFSDFLQRENKWSDAKQQLEELFRHSRAARSSVIWIEPGWNQANPEQGGFFKRVANWANTWIRSFVRSFPENGEPGEVGRSSANVVHPLKTNDRFQTNLAVKRFDLIRCP